MWDFLFLFWGARVHSQAVGMRVLEKRGWYHHRRGTATVGAPPGPKKKRRARSRPEDYATYALPIALSPLLQKRCAKFCGRVDGAASILSYIWFFRNKRATHDAVANRVVERILIPVRSPILGGGNEGSSCALAGISGRGCG